MMVTDIPHVKVTLIGEAGVGKSTLSARMVQKHRPSEGATIGAAFFSYNYANKYSLQIWDTAGAEKFQSLLPMYLRGAHFIIAVYDATSPESLDKVVAHRKTILRNVVDADKAVWILVGNKMDLVSFNDRSIFFKAKGVASKWRTSEATEWEMLNGQVAPVSLDSALHVACSANTGENVSDLMKMIVDLIEDHYNGFRDFKPETTIIKIGAEMQEDGNISAPKTRRTCCIGN